jgi:hypothetical protein
MSGFTSPFSANSQGAVTNVMLNGMSQMTEKVIKQINSLYDINISRNEELFTYVLDNESIVVTPAGTNTGIITIEDSVNFVWCAWSAEAWDNTDPTLFGAMFTVMVKFHGTDRYLSNSHPFNVPIHKSFIASNGAGTPAMTWLPMPYVLKRSTQLSFFVTNLQAAMTIRVRFALHGYRIFSYDSLNMAVRRK